MANEQNLILFGDMDKDKHREYASRGGKRSGEVKRQRKAMKEQFDLLLSLPFNIKDRQGREVKKTLAELGIDEDKIDNQMAMVIALWRTALGNGKNQVTAFQEIRKVVQDEQKEKDNNINNVKDILVKIKEVANNDRDKNN